MVKTRKKKDAALTAAPFQVHLLFQLAGGQLGQIGVQEPVQIAAPHAPETRGGPAFDSNGRAKPVHFKVLLRKTLGRRIHGGGRLVAFCYFFSSPVASWVR